MKGLFLPQRGRIPTRGQRATFPALLSAKLTGEGERTICSNAVGKKKDVGSPSSPASRDCSLRSSFACKTCHRQLLLWQKSPLGEAQTVDKVGILSSRTSDRCHWCGDPYPKSLENTTFLKKNGLPRQCAHWLAMTHFGVCLHIESVDSLKARMGTSEKSSHPCVD